MTFRSTASLDMYILTPITPACCWRCVRQRELVASPGGPRLQVGGREALWPHEASSCRLAPPRRTAPRQCVVRRRAAPRARAAARAPACAARQVGQQRQRGDAEDEGGRAEGGAQADGLDHEAPTDDGDELPHLVVVSSKS